MDDKEIMTAAPLTAIEKVVVGNDLSALRPEERWSYYRWRCESIGLDPAARPFQYITFQGKLTLYADKGCAEQLRALHKITVKPLPAQVVDGVFCQYVIASAPDGRSATDMGAVPVAGLRGEDLAKAMKKAMTQANRRATLALIGLGAQDLEEVEGVQPLDPKAVEETNLLPASVTGQETPKHDGPIEWTEPNKWPAGDPTIITAKVTGVRRSKSSKAEWLTVTVEDGEPVTLSTFHLSAEPVLNAAIGRVCDIMYMRKDKGNQLLDVREAKP